MNSPALWIRHDGAFAPIVDPEMFAAAQRVAAERADRRSDEQAIEDLKRVLARYGRLSRTLIGKAEGTLSRAGYVHRFGSLARAYQLAGFTCPSDTRFLDTRRVLEQVHASVLGEIVANVERRGGTVRSGPDGDLLNVNEEFTVRVVVTLCRKPGRRTHRWRLRLGDFAGVDLVVAVRMAPGNREVLDYYLLPRHVLSGKTLWLGEGNGIALDAYRCDSLDGLYRLAARARPRPAP